MGAKKLHQAVVLTYAFHVEVAANEQQNESNHGKRNKNPQLHDALSACKRKCGYTKMLLTGNQPFTCPLTCLTYDVCDHGRKLHASALSHRNRLTFLSNQFHLNTIFSMLTAITALVRGFKLIDANREVSTRASVGEGFHSASFGVSKPNLAFRLKVDQVCPLNFDP